MKKLNRYRKNSMKWSAKQTQRITLGFISLCASCACFADASGDYLAPSRATVASNFGVGSTFMWLVVAAELVLGVTTFVKTKSVYALLGVVLVSIFINTIGAVFLAAS